MRCGGSRAAWPLHRPSPATRDRNGASPATCAARPPAPPRRPRSRSARPSARSEEHTSELQSLMRISYAVFCLKKKKIQQHIHLIYSITSPAQHIHTHNTKIILYVTAAT